MTCACGHRSATQRTEALSAELQAEFTYYWYAAKQAIEQEQFDRAFMLLRFCESLHPSDGQTHDYLGMIYDVLGEKDTALEHYRQAYINNPQDLWLHYAEKLFNSGDAKSRKEAVRVLEHAARLNPEDANCLDNLRHTYLSTGDWRKSIKMQDRIDALRGYDAYSALHRYQAYVVAGKNKEAIEAIDHYLEKEPTDLRFMLFRLELLERVGAKPERLIEAYQQILSIEPNHPMVLNNYAYLLATHGGDLQLAEKMSQRSLISSPDNPTYLDTYAWILHLQGQDLLATYYIRKALQNAQTDTDKRVIKEHYDQIVH